MTYIHELADWPSLTWDDSTLAQPLAAVRHRQGRLIGRMEALGFPLREEAVLRTLTEDVPTIRSDFDISKWHHATISRDPNHSSAASWSDKLS